MGKAKKIPASIKRTVLKMLLKKADENFQQADEEKKLEKLEEQLTRIDDGRT